MPANPILAPGLTCIGSLLVDDIAKPRQILHARASNPVRWTQGIGGVAANVARAAALRTQTSLISAAGNDMPALLKHPSLSPLDCQWIKQDQPFDRYTAVLDEHGELFVGLASTELAESLKLSDIQPLIDRPKESKPPQAFAIDANLSAECLCELVAYLANEYSASTIAALPISPEKAIKWRDCANDVDVLFCNRREAAALTGLETEETSNTLIRALEGLGFTSIVLTDAGKPITVLQEQQLASVPVPAVTISSTVNGAGDALCGATLSHYVRNQDLERSVSTAGLAAAHCILTGTPLNYPIAT